MIKAEVIQDSVSPAGIRITTLELEYPRFIHSELMTHRVFSRNAASSRAIPVAVMLRMVWNNPAMPIHWGQNQPGMQAKRVLTGIQYTLARGLWRGAAKAACAFAWGMMKVGLHKQVANRILEPFQHIKVVVTATDWDNFFELRCHPDAQPEFQALATQIRDARAASTPQVIGVAEWHLPYIERHRDIHGTLLYSIPGEVGSCSLANAIKISASCCAQVSYRKLDDSLEKARDVYQRLIESRPIHASPFEHQATPERDPDDHHLCGNFTGWVQHRKLLEHEDHWLDEMIVP